jgi:hypothetical protein
MSKDQIFHRKRQYKTNSWDRHLDTNWYFIDACILLGRYYTRINKISGGIEVSILGIDFVSAFFCDIFGSCSFPEWKGFIGNHGKIINPKVSGLD